MTPRGPVVNIQEAVSLYWRVSGTDICSYTKCFPTRSPFESCWLIFQHNSHVFRAEFMMLDRRFKVYVDGAILGIITESRADEPPLLKVNPKATSLGMREAGDLVQETAVICTFAIELMLCKNINYAEYDPMENATRQRRRHLERKRKELLKYQVLHINPLSAKTVNRKPTVEAQERSVAVHSVRGHFKTATADHPLFGKPWGVGTFWCGPYVCGNPEFGLNWNDYHIEIEGGAP